MTFGERLKQAREKKQLTKAALGKLVGVHYSQIGRYERNEANPSSDVLRKMANGLDVTTDYLMNGTSIDLAGDQIADKTLINQFKKISILSEENKKIVVALIDAFLFQQEMKSRFVS
jgi:transcriptional regulator with XRE-family HTH domain